MKVSSLFVRVCCFAMVVGLAPVPATAGSASPFTLPTARFPDDDALEKVLARLDADSLKERQQAAQSLQNATQLDAARLHRTLHRRTEIAPVDYRNVLRSIGAHVPDHRGRFGAAPAKEVDWLGALLRKRVGRSLQSAQRESRRSVALMRGLVSTGHPEAAMSLLRFAYRHQSAFKDECGRLLRRMKNQAIPALLRARSLRDPLAFKIARYAAYQLDRINRSRPELALKQSDPQLVVRILHAYGEVKDPGAVNAVLSLTNAADVRVRRAARWALLRYISGRPPTAVRRHLRLPGGRKTESERSLYLTYRQLAHQALVKTLSTTMAANKLERQKLAKRLLAEEDPRSLAARLFQHYDGQRLHAQRQQYLEGQRHLRSGKLAKALALFDKILLDDPEHPQSHLMAEAYEKRGLALLDAGKHRQAVLWLTKASQLLPGAIRNPSGLPKIAARVRAERALAEALRDGTSGRKARWKLQEALLLAPTHPRVLSTVAELNKSRRRGGMLAAGSAAVVFALFLAGIRWRGRLLRRGDQ